MTQKWWTSGQADVDMLLDPLALATEVLIRGRSSPWARYICTIPNETEGYNLPFSYSR